jgi:hypothetical protein
VSARAHLAVVGGKRGSSEPRELCVVVGCHGLACVVPARWIERLVLPGEVASIATADHEPGAAPLVLVGEKAYSAWNLGLLLGLAPLDAAWLLLRVEHKGESLPIALHTGPCLVVLELAPGVALPPGAFRSRVGALASVLGTASMKGKFTTEVALWLDPAHMWHPDELDGAAAALRAARQA